MRVKNLVLVFSLIYFIFPCSVSAGTCGSSDDSSGLTHCTGTSPWTADSVSYADVNHCINTCATYNDVVNIPAGSAEWGTSSLIVQKGMTIIGSGKTTTTIKCAPASYQVTTYCIALTPDATTAQNNYPYSMYGLSLQAYGDYPPYALLWLQNATPDDSLSRVSIHDIRFLQLDSSASSDSRMAVVVYPGMFGVAYNNDIVNGSHAWRYLGDRGGFTDMETGSGEQWEFGSANAMYFEDNNITGTGLGDGMVVSGGAGNRYVSRYNIFIRSSDADSSAVSPWLDIHGNQSNNGGAGIGFVVYGNSFTGGRPEGAKKLIDQRAGRVLAYYNEYVYPSSPSPNISIREECDDTTYGPIESCPEGKNCLQHPNDSYYFANMVGTSSPASNLLVPYVSGDHFANGSVCGDNSTLNDPLIIVENAKFWLQRSAAFDGSIAEVGSCGYYDGDVCTKSGVGCGTLASRPETCTTGVGYWATDQSCSDLTGMVGANPTTPISGTLYKCTDTNTWTAYYTPYTYPHPLRSQHGRFSGSGSFNVR